MKEMLGPRITGLARVISLLFHPVFMPTISFVVVLFSGELSIFALPNSIRTLVILMVSINTCLLPIVFSFTLKRFGFIKTMEMDTTNERWIPYMFTTILYLLTYFLLRKAQLSTSVYLMQLGGILALTLTTLINFKWKISAHLVGIGGLTGTFYGLQFITNQNYLWHFLIGLTMAGIVASARLVLKAHTPAQVYAGFLLGFCCVAGIFIFV
jgi:membrane-associated phospholipid phosphatase